MVRQLLQQLQGVLSTKDSVETARVCRAIVEEGVRTVCLRLGKEAKPTTGLLELLSRPEVSGFVDDAEVSQALEFVRILGANATHGRRIKKTQAEFAANATSDFLDILDVKLTGGTLPPKKAKDSEDATRRLYIDLYLGEAKWNVLEEKNVALPSSAAIEIAIDGMPNAAGKGYADYVLYDKGGRPLAVIEAKKAGVDPGEHFSGSLVAFVRTLAGLDMAVVQERFGKYLEGNLFNSAQQEFVDAIIRYVRENGEITRTDIANAPQFIDDDPVALFGEKMPDLLEFITQIEKACPQAA